MSSPRVLFHIASYPACNEMFVIIDFMLKVNDVEIFVLPENACILNHIRSNFAERDIHLLDFYPYKKKTQVTPKNEKKAKISKFTFLKKFKRVIYNLRLWDWYQQQLFDRLIKARIEQCRKLILEINPCCLIVRGDRHLGEFWEGALLKVCGEKSIRRVVIPIAASGIEGLLYCRRKKKQLVVNGSSKLMNEFQKQIALDPKTGDYLLYKEAYVLRALRKNGILFDNPWVIGGGYSDLVFVPGKSAFDRYVKIGCNPQKMVITGHGSNDQLYEIYKRRKILEKNCQKKYSLSPNKKNIIVALPQLAEHKFMSWEEHWEEIRFICTTMQELNANVLFSLHPRMDPQKYQFLVEEYGIPILKERLIEVLPIADIYVCTFSSTLEWALLCGIPTVIIDFYSFGYTSYDDVESLKIINNKSDFLTEINLLLSDSLTYKKIQEMAKRDSPRFGILDGNCRKRIMEHILQ